MSTRVLQLIALAGLTLMLGLGNEALARGEVIELDETFMRVEINATDGDAGLHGFWDGEGWHQMRVRGPNGRTVLYVYSRGNVRQQTLTEMFFESSEPNFEEQSLEEFLDRFPAGEYTFIGRTPDRDRLVGEAELTHDLPAAPEVALEQDEEEIDPEEDGVDPNEDLIIRWEAVEDDFRGGPLGSDILFYVVVVEFEDEDDDTVLVYRMEVPANGSNDDGDLFCRVPSEFLVPDAEMKFEVGAREESGNQTFTEVEFETDEEEDGDD